ncbi:unnamed protein product, partial [Brassica oleracea]
VHLEVDVDDVPFWRDGHTEFHSRFSTAATWNSIRSYGETQDWCRAILFFKGVLRFSFITWLAVKDRFATGTRMTNWGQI